jgi:hypothetical protein
MSALTITPAAILVAFPTEVTSPVKLALVTTVAALPTEVTPPVRLAFVTTVVALPTEVTIPVKLALVVTLPAVKPEAVPVKLVAVPLEGVPNAPPLTTNAPEEPVFIPSAVATPVPRDVMPVPPEAAGSAEPKVKEVKYEAASTTFVPLL